MEIINNTREGFLERFFNSNPDEFKIISRKLKQQVEIFADYMPDEFFTCGYIDVSLANGWNGIRPRQGKSVNVASYHEVKIRRMKVERRRTHYWKDEIPEAPIMWITPRSTYYVFGPGSYPERYPSIRALKQFDVIREGLDRFFAETVMCGL